MKIIPFFLIAFLAIISHSNGQTVYERKIIGTWKITGLELLEFGGIPIQELLKAEGLNSLEDLRVNEDWNNFFLFRDEVIESGELNFGQNGKCSFVSDEEYVHSHIKSWRMPNAETLIINTRCGDAQVPILAHKPNYLHIKFEYEGIPMDMYLEKKDVVNKH